MAVTLTSAAATHVAGMLQKRGHGLGLRIGTKKSGCSGYAGQISSTRSAWMVSFSSTSSLRPVSKLEKSTAVM